MRHLRRIAILAALLGFGPGCQSSSGLCPEGMKVVAGRSDKAKAVWCKSKDGSAAQWTQYHAPGDVRQVCRYAGGAPQGPFQAFHPGAKRWLVGQYQGGEKQGLWVQWNDAGHKVADGEYRAGRLVKGAPVGMVALCEQQRL